MLFTRERRAVTGKFLGPQRTDWGFEPRCSSVLTSNNSHRVTHNPEEQRQTQTEQQRLEIKKKRRIKKMRGAKRTGNEKVEVTGG